MVTAVTVRGVEASVVSLAVGRGSQSHQIVQFEIRHVTATDRTLVDVTRTGTLFHVQISTICTHLEFGIEHTRTSTAPAESVLWLVVSRVTTSAVVAVESDRRRCLCDGSSRRRPSGERVIDNIIHTQFPPNVCRMSN